MATQFDPASGTRDFLADDVAKLERAFDVIRTVFARYGFEPLQTPAFERLDVLMGKYGEDGDKLVFKILRRGEHEATGEADLALRYDHTVPLARVAAAYGSQLPSPYKRYVLGPSSLTLGHVDDYEPFVIQPPAALVDRTESVRGDDPPS